MKEGDYMIICVVGPTGVGKTKLSVELAKKYNLPSKNYIDAWKKQLLKKGLLSAEECNKSQIKTYSLKSPEKKTAYEKQLEKENLRLRAELAFYKELQNLIDEDNKKK